MNVIAIIALNELRRYFNNLTDREACKIIDRLIDNVILTLFANDSKVFHGKEVYWNERLNR